MSVVVIGIDPGVGGGIVGLTEDGVVLAERMPTRLTGIKSRERIDVKALTKMLHGVEGRIAMVALEELGLRPGQSAQSNATSGRNHGRIETVLEMLELPHDLVQPQRWKKLLGVAGGTPDEQKARAIALCQRMLPTLELVPLGCKKANSGIADAGCLAMYARRIVGGMVDATRVEHAQEGLK